MSLCSFTSHWGSLVTTRTFAVAVLQDLAGNDLISPLHSHRQYPIVDPVTIA